MKTKHKPTKRLITVAVRASLYNKLFIHYEGLYYEFNQLEFLLDI